MVLLINHPDSFIKKGSIYLVLGFLLVFPGMAP